MTESRERPWSEHRKALEARRDECHTQCDALGYGQCLTLACMKRGGWNKDYPHPDVRPTCQIRDEHDALEVALALGDRDREIREWLWLNHGCETPMLYGDDGELQCNSLSCRIDFKREPLPQIIGKILKALGDRCAELQHERDAYFETAREMSNNAEFYRGLIRQTGELLGEAAR